MAALRIIALCIAAAVLYGIVHDEITARVCVKYFTVGHPRIIASESPTLLALVWGVIATWWVGLLLGVPLAFTALWRTNRRPPRPARTLVRPITYLLACMAVVALIAGVVGYALARGGYVVLLPPMADWVADERHALFVADLWAHNASYAAGFVGGLVVIRQVWRGRSARGSVLTSAARSPG